MKFKAGNIYFNYICVIQSLLPDDRKTGRELFDDIIGIRASFSTDLVAQIFEVKSKKELISCLEAIKLKIKKGLIPLIHFETHGFKEGITMSNSEDVLWDEIVPIVREINSLTGNNLFVSVAACKGGNIQFSVKITEPCPFRGFIGPMDDVMPDDLLNSFSDFFNVLILNNDFEGAIDALNTTAHVKYNHMNVEAFFEKVIDNHIALEKHDPSRFRKFVEEITDIQIRRTPAVLIKFGRRRKVKRHVQKFIKSERPVLLELLRKRFCHIE